MWRPDNTTPGWSCLRAAQFWKSERPKYVELRKRITTKPPTFTVVELGEDAVKVLKVERDGIIQTYSLYKTTGDQAHPTNIPQGLDQYQFAAVLLDADLGQVPHHVLDALEKAVPTLVFGSSSQRVSAMARDIIQNRGDMVQREVMLYIKPLVSNPGALVPFRVGNLAIIATPATISHQV